MTNTDAEGRGETRGSTGDGIVQVAYLHNEHVSHSWVDSMRRMWEFDLTEGGRRIARRPLNLRCGAGMLAHTRNYGARLFLDKTPHEWLLYVDTDMGFDDNAVHRLLEAADPVSRPIVGALCFAFMEAHWDGQGGWRRTIVPTMYKLGTVGEGQGSFCYYGDYIPDEVTPVAATGGAFLLIHRGVLEKLRTSHGDHWFDQLYDKDGDIIGEDIAFCGRALEAGYVPAVHTGVRTTHHKEIWLAEQDYLMQMTAGTSALPPPASERAAVIVPVMRRPDNAEPFMASLRASTGMATVYAVTDAADIATRNAWREAGAEIIVRSFASEGPGTFAEKANLGYRSTTEPWLLFVGDDVRFWPGWLDIAQAAAAEHGAEVVGTNDLGTERVRAGLFSPHLLIARDYIERVGASWDGPGVVAHEGYRHWYVDDEMVTAAKQRGVWTMALDSVIEHLHPLFGKADKDEVYELGVSHAEADAVRYAERLATYARAGV